jgi:hypothetical protein
MFKNIFISAIIFITSFSVLAAPQTYKATARVTNITEYTAGALAAPLNIGDEITMTYIMDDAKTPDYENSWNIFYTFNQNQASIQVSWSNVTLKTSPQAMIDHAIGRDVNNGNGVQFYHLGSPGPFENNGNPVPALQFIAMDLVSYGPSYQPYQPWLTPDLSKFTMKQLHAYANGFWFEAEVSSIVNTQEIDGPFPVWPGNGNMHISQQFDLFVTAPAGYDFIELISEAMPMAPPLPIPCEMVPNFNGQAGIRFLCRNLNPGILQLWQPNNNGVTIKLRNHSTGQTLQRLMNWRMVE